MIDFPTFAKNLVLETFMLILIAVSLSAEAFSGVFLNGFIRKAGFASLLLVVCTIALMNALMAVAGELLGSLLQGLLGSFAAGISVGILAVLGVKLLIKSFRPGLQVIAWELLRPRILLTFSLAMGINAFLAGLALAAFKIPILHLALIFAALFALSTLVGIIAGRISSKFKLAGTVLFSGGLILSVWSIIFFLQLFHII